MVCSYKKGGNQIEPLTSRSKGNLHDQCAVTQWSEKIDSVPFFKFVPKLILSFGLIFLYVSVWSDSIEKYFCFFSSNFSLSSEKFLLAALHERRKSATLLQFYSPCTFEFRWRFTVVNKKLGWKKGAQTPSELRHCFGENNKKADRSQVCPLPEQYLKHLLETQVRGSGPADRRENVKSKSVSQPPISD